MELHKKSAEFYVPNGQKVDEAIKKTTHMAIAAHQDDIEIMAYHGIETCFQQEDKSFFGVVVTNGSGSARENLYKNYTDEQMIAVRKVEQKKAAMLGEFGLLALLDYPSNEVKTNQNEALVNEFAKLIEASKPEVVYTHNLADKHDTHIGVVVNVIKAIRSLPKTLRPKLVLGCEVWRGLDWINDDEKVYLDVSNHPNLAASLVEVFDSQIIGGKRYDKAAIGRRLANATFTSSHVVDQSDALTYAMDLTPLIEDDKLDLVRYTTSYIERFKNDVEDKIKKVL